MSVERIDLVAIAPDGVTCTAVYCREPDKPWKLESWIDDRLNFLKFCSFSVAPIALMNRGFTWSWTHRREVKNRFERQGYHMYKPSGRYKHAKRFSQRL